jgi:integrase/recombinase XerD
VLYYSSPTFKRLDPSTQAWRRRALDSICEKYGDKPVALMMPRHVRKIRDERSDMLGAANIRLKALRALFAWATEAEECENNPTIGVKKISYVTNEYHTWTAEEIERYKARHPFGTKPRLALDLLRFTTGRREDAPRLGPPHIRNGRIQFRQAKNEHRNPVDIDIPLHPELAASIAATPSGHLTFLVTEYGRPYTSNGFGNAVRDWCDQANLHHCSAHGLRKATPTQMAENDATPHQIMAVTGHQSLEEVERYTRKAQRRKLADAAMAKLK